ncbi:hypothetical protein SARC_14809, partial [Sphaeroforma arctica JP610]
TLISEDANTALAATPNSALQAIGIEAVGSDNNEPTVLPSSTPAPSPSPSASGPPQEDDSSNTALIIGVVVSVVVLLLVCCVCAGGLWWYLRKKKGNKTDGSRGSAQQTSNPRMDQMGGIDNRGSMYG